MAYQVRLERVAARLAAVPGRFSEENVTRLGALNHFETFEDTIDGRKRLSLSGSIVVLDIDLLDNQVSSVSVSLDSPNDTKTLLLDSENSPNECILSALKQPRLDQFTSLLEFLSRCDRFSTKSVDCFQALDSISRAIIEKADNKVEGPFGVPEFNPSRLGMGLYYYGDTKNKKHAFLDVRGGSKKEFALVNTQWLGANGEWIDPEPPQHDIRAEFVLRLEPPVLIPHKLAQEWSASVIAYKELNRQSRATFTVSRHPRFCNVETEDTFDVILANTLPYRFVQVSEIPIKHPKHIVEILHSLRLYSELQNYKDSLLDGTPLYQSSDMDISIADVVELKDKPLATKNIAVDATIEQNSDKINLIVVISQAKTTINISLSPGAETAVDVNKAINLGDLKKIVQTKKLGLLLSYVVGSLGLQHRRMSLSL